MIGSWLGFAFAFVVSVMLVYLPGITLAYCLRIKGFLSLAVAPIISVALLSSFAVIFASLGIKWKVWYFCGAVLLLALLLLGIRRLFGKILINTKPQKTELIVVSWRGLFVPLCVGLVAGFVLFVRVLLALRVPFAFSQSSDGHYHYNSVASMLESGDLSSLHMLQLPPNSSFYPAAWHDFVTSVIHVTGVSIPVAANAFTYFLLCFVWPLSMLTFALCISKNKVFLTTVVLICNLIPFFPGIYLYFGILYANIVGLSFIPVVFFIVVTFLFRQKYFQYWQSILLGIFSVFALGFSQPNTVFSVYYIVLIVLPFAGYELGKKYDTITKQLVENNVDKKYKFAYKNRIIFTLLGVLSSILIACLVIYICYKTPTLYNAKFTPNMLVRNKYDYYEGILTFLTSAIRFLPVSLDSVFYETIYISVLSFSGIFFILWKKRNAKYLWLIVGWLWFSFLVFVSATCENKQIRAFLTGLYYGDTVRFIPIQTVFMVIFISLSILFIFSKLKLVFVDKDGNYSFKTITILGLLVVFISGHSTSVMKDRFDKLEYNFSLPDDNFQNVLAYSKHELEFMKNNATKVDKSYTFAGNPRKGVTASWFMFGQKNIFYHVQTPKDKYHLLLAEDLQNANTNPNVCKAVKKYNLRYIYSFSGKCQWNKPCDKKYPSFDNLDGKNVAKIIDQDKYGNKLYEITACKD